MRTFRLLPLLLLLLSLSAAADDPPKFAPEVERLASSWLAREPVAALADDLDLAAAGRIRDAFVERLAAELGPPVGYKAALTSAAVQQRFGVDEPLRGTLFQKMLLPSGSRVGLDAGSRLAFEGDLVVRVGDAAINAAQSRGEALAALDAVMPFLEIPDLAYVPDVEIDGPALMAINAGARAGILGAPIELTGEGWAERLAEVEVELVGRGVEGMSGRGSALLGHPLDVVLWLRDALRDDGVALRPGDLLSLGSITPLTPAVAGEFTARYTGLGPQPIEISVTFTSPGPV
jgi:2-keto-4-pentenoate hydratase